MTSSDNSYVQIGALTRQFGTEVAVRNLILSVSRGEFITLLGPSGCGKTTTLRCIAGLERPDAGEIHIDGCTVSSAARGIHLEPEERNIGMVFQSYAVWPHMTVFDNVAYGLQVRRTAGAETQARTMKALERVGMAAFADRFATKLSGGQRQRVALARAIAYEPRVILLDEPLSNLDAKLREQMRVELMRLQREVGITSIYVTHDQTEALVMSDRVVVMNHGVIQQIGDPRAVYARPANAFVARFIGVTNLFTGTLLDRSGGICEVEVAAGQAHARPLLLRAAGGEGGATRARVVLSVRPEDIELHTRRPVARQSNVIEGKVRDIAYFGRFRECNVCVGQYELNVQIEGDAAVAPGQMVFLTFRFDHGLCLAD
jgi:iron(III) transport system ATP-binding protein